MVLRAHHPFAGGIYVPPVALHHYRRQSIAERSCRVILRHYYPVAFGVDKTVKPGFLSCPNACACQTLRKIFYVNKCRPDNDIALCIPKAHFFIGGKPKKLLLRI